jgi:hypothetical protein
MTTDEIPTFQRRLTVVELETPEQIDERMRAIDMVLGDRMRPILGSCYTAWEPLVSDDYPALAAARERTALCWRYIQVQGSTHPIAHVPRRQRPSARERRQFQVVEWLAVAGLLAVGTVVAALVLAAEEVARLRGLFGGG